MRGDSADAGERDGTDLEIIAAAKTLSRSPPFSEPQRTLPWWPSFPF